MWPESTYAGFLNDTIRVIFFKDCHIHLHAMMIRNRQQNDISMIFTAKIGDNIMHIDKSLLQRFVVIQQKSQHPVEGIQSLVEKVFSKSISVSRQCEV
ncbi:MAG: hypothetical protein ACTS85_03690 [Arsenophonus sp. NC-PG7-MAG3]